MPSRIPAILALAAILAAPATGVAHILPMTDAMAVMDVVHAHLSNSDDLDIALVAEGTYAIAFWKAEKGHSAGAALVKNSSKGWTLVKMQSVPFTTAAQLEALGTSATVANALIADLKKQGSEGN